MNTAQVLCSGCNKLVTLNGLASHLWKTKDLHCCTMHKPVQAPGSICGAASSVLALIQSILSNQSPINFLVCSAANQWPQDELELALRSQEGKLATTRISCLTLLLIICTIHVTVVDTDSLSGKGDLDADWGDGYILVKGKEVTCFN